MAKALPLRSYRVMNQRQSGLFILKPPDVSAEKIDMKGLLYMLRSIRAFILPPAVKENTAEDEGTYEEFLGYEASFYGRFPYLPEIEGDELPGIGLKGM